MSGLEIRELEAFLALARELHFGRAGQRLHVSQSRVSQLIRALESRVGAPLVERTSRRVRLTPLGEGFLADLDPAYDLLRRAVDDVRAAARGVAASLRVGFQGAVDGHLADALTLFGERRPDCAVELVEIPLADPFGALHRREVDAAVVLLPVREPDLVVGPVFSRNPHTLAVSARHPFSARAAVSAEELAGCAVIGVHATAPGYWRDVHAPTRTPGGRAVPAGPAVHTLQEGLSLVAANRGAMLLCRATAVHHAHRRSVVFVPVTGLPDSELGVVRHRRHPGPQARAFAQAVLDTLPGRSTGQRGGRRGSGAAGARTPAGRGPRPEPGAGQSPPRRAAVQG